MWQVSGHACSDAIGTEAPEQVRVSVPSICGVCNEHVDVDALLLSGAGETSERAIRLAR